MPPTLRHRPSSRRQRGAVLYVAMIMLILLALLGLVGMQVTGMQERMSANYGRVNAAFQNAEALARQREASIQSSLYSGAGTFVADEELCSTTFDPTTWANASSAASSTHTKRIDKCFTGSSLKVGAKQNEETGNIYQVSALRGDLETNPTATAVIDTIFIP
ncbi:MULTISPECIES: pilus assembly PilX family protein [Lysobacter]|jgi:type IV pilus assembly protein PilX|uniref:pilus assembly PilX family protein n=2 Tax=Lysobacteraceae TaxID=32033 RepID=UPI001F1D71CD|nr:MULTISPECIES: PilX N-terminal domain-containing pilus assembly protein [Lysobacter]UJB20581.1 PilX N-terminal domain-containing pilus assembly protein [Lysobacter capsici]UJQ30305.1 PilX N-terminal domain-containing pilus assembly protein [Lysobacter gummosus]